MTICVVEGGKFTDFKPAGRCCGNLVPVTDAIPDGKGGCAQPNCPCYVCTQCGDATCGKGENYCNCPKDCAPPPPIKAAITNEVWYQGNTTCNAASMAVTASKGIIKVNLNQIPHSDVPGSCKGHSATVSRTGPALTLTLGKTGGGACWTACWDFAVRLAPVAPGTYTVKYLSFSKTVTVP